MKWLPIAGAVVAVALLPAAQAAPAVSTITIDVLSNRADLISDGDALVAVALPAGVDASTVSVDVDGRDVTSAFAVRQGGQFEGIVTGLALGPNVLTARAPNGSGARITITNHSRGGPIFSGAQVQPLICQTATAGLGPPQDDECDAPTKYEFFYKSTDTTKMGFQAYNPASPPSDVATTTTDQGKTVPYIVRRETGTADRGVYQLALLFNPAQPWQPWAPQVGWNHKLFGLFGEGCAPDHYQGTAGATVLNEMALSRGFAVVSSSNFILGQQCNDVVAAETLVILEEHLVEGYGSIRYTIGDGCSGGSMMQHMIADKYPGLLNGIRPTCSFPDHWTEQAFEDHDCPLLEQYFNMTSPQLWTNEAQRAAVLGHPSDAICEEVSVLFSNGANLWKPNGSGCGFTTADAARYRYDPVSKPDGTRCTMQDYYESILGQRPSSVWTNPEQRIGHGFANRMLDSVGVQYGLNALQQGLIVPEQFVDLNEKIGGYDIDWNPQAKRTEADLLALQRMYRGDQITYGRQLAKVPIIDARTDNNAEAHSNFFPMATEARLKAVNGNADNQVQWFEAQPGLFGAPSADRATQSFLTMDQWLRNIEVDTSNAPLEEKVLDDRPPEAVDACFIGGQRFTDPTVCNTVHTFYGIARTAAGMPLAANVLKCQLKPLNRSDNYGPVPFTDAQWARLQAAFPTGVCDWSKPGVGQQPPAGPWLTYEGGPGGEPLPPPPVSTPLNPTAVVVSSLRATRTARGVLVRWRTGSEARLLGFDVFRGRVKLNRTLIAASGTSAGRSYSFLDRTAPVASTRYWLRLVSQDGRRRWRGPVQIRSRPT